MTNVPITTRPPTRTERRRWFVHLGLLITLAGSLLSLIWLSRSITIHVVIGVLFLVFLCGHLYQRRRTMVALLRRMVRVNLRTTASGRLAISDTILLLLVANVLISGIVDALNHQETQLTFLASIGFPPGLVQWHKLSAFILVLYVVVHVSRRRKRLRNSRIR